MGRVDFFVQVIGGRKREGMGDLALVAERAFTAGWKIQIRIAGSIERKGSTWMLALVWKVHPTERVFLEEKACVDKGEIMKGDMGL
jgi:hypothetical protein